MLLTTIGSEYWPQTPEGRLLTFLLSLYSLGILGYITATLASFFVEKDLSRKACATDAKLALVLALVLALRC